MRFIWIIFIFFIFFACGGKIVREKNEYSTYYKGGDYLYKQRMRILNSSKVLYKYANYGEFARSNWYYGKFILDSQDYPQSFSIQVQQFALHPL